MQKIHDLAIDWERKFEEVGITEDVLKEANISKKYYESIYKIISLHIRMRQDFPTILEIKEAWQLQLLTGKREYYEPHALKCNNDKYNTAYYAFCSVSAEAYDYLFEVNPALFIALQNKDEVHIMGTLTYLLVESRNISMLKKLIALFNHPDLVLINSITTDWLEGIQWVDENYPDSFRSQKNFMELTDLIYYPHHVAFIHFNLQILNWFKKHKDFLFYDETVNYPDHNILAEDATRYKTTEKLDWLLANTPQLIDPGLLKKIMGKPRFMLEWFKNNKPEYFPLSRDACVPLANIALSEKNAELFNEVLLLSSASNITHFPIHENFNNINIQLTTLNEALNTNSCLESITIHRNSGSFFSKLELVNRNTLLEVSQKLERNKNNKIQPILSIMLLDMLDTSSKLPHGSPIKDAILCFCKKLSSDYNLYEQIEPLVFEQENADNDLVEFNLGL